MRHNIDTKAFERVSGPVSCSHKTTEQGSGNNGLHKVFQPLNSSHCVKDYRFVIFEFKGSLHHSWEEYLENRLAFVWKCAAKHLRFLSI